MDFKLPCTSIHIETYDISNFSWLGLPYRISVCLVYLLIFSSSTRNFVKVVNVQLFVYTSASCLIQMPSPKHFWEYIGRMQRLRPRFSYIEVTELLHLGMYCRTVPSLAQGNRVMQVCANSLSFLFFVGWWPTSINKAWPWHSLLSRFEGVNVKYAKSCFLLSPIVSCGLCEPKQMRERTAVWQPAEVGYYTSRSFPSKIFFFRRPFVTSRRLSPPTRK